MELSSVGRSLAQIDRITTAALGLLSRRECVKKFLGFCARLQPILEQLDAGEGRELAAAAATAVDGIGGELQRAESVLDSYKARSQFFVLAHCCALDKVMEDLTQGLGKWISLLQFVEMPELKRRIEELSWEMRNSRFRVTDAEQRSLEALTKELRGSYDSFILGALWRDLARLIGLEPETNSAALQEQIQLLKQEVTIDCDKDIELEKMRNMLNIVEHVTAEPQLTRMYSYKESADDEPLPSYESFVCPLTQQIMKDPVMIQSELTYERTAIERWFRTCFEEGRSLTCPVTGVLLTSTEMRSNIMLRSTIEEWSQRNARIRIGNAMAQISSSPAPKLETAEEALDSIIKVCCEDAPMIQHRLGKSHFTDSLLEFWKRKMPERSQVRSKALLILQKIAADDLDNQRSLVKAGVLKAAVRSLASNQVNEIEGGLKLLLEVSKTPEIAKLIGKEKGALIHLLGISSNSSGATSLSVLADKTLKNLEQIDTNVWEMAEAGRLDPLLTRLCEGPEETKIEAANFLAEKIFVNSQKEYVARKAGSVLVEMLSSSPMRKEAAIGALLSLSLLEENVPVLVKAGILLPLVDIILSVPTSSNPLRIAAKEKAATTLANIVAIAGSWESVKIDSAGNTMQSEYFVHGILGLLSSVGPDWNNKLLKILTGVASSPQAADVAVKHVVSGNGIKMLLTLFQSGEDDDQLSLLSLLNVLSLRAGREIAQAVAQTTRLQSLKEVFKRKGGEKSILAGSIITNLPLTQDETINFLGLDMIGWCVTTIDELKTRRMGSARVTSSMLEGVLGVLLHFARCWDSQVLEAMKQNKLMSRFAEQLHQGQAWVAKQRAATGLGYLSERGLSTQLPASRSSMRKSLLLEAFGCFVPASNLDEMCPIHRTKCDPDESFCLRASDSIALLVELLAEEKQELSVQIAAVEALSTLVRTDSVLEDGVREISKAGGVRVIVRWFQTLRSSSSSVAQEKAVFLVERILRAEEHSRCYSLDEGLIRALVEVFKHGSSGARKNAEAALSHAGMMHSVASGNESNAGGKRR